jgi:cysteine-rich repeat protein
MACGTGKLCRNKVCSPAVCGDGIVTPPEECDDGNSVNGDGCDSNCKFSCVSTDATRDCQPADVCEGKGTCNDATHVCTPGTPAKDGTMCGNNEVCKGGHCTAGNCGDGIVEAPEQCDFGAGNGIGTGCEANCTFSCTTSPNSCVTQDVCAGANTCTAFTMGASPGQKCVLGAPLPDGTTCPNGGMCKGHLCITANCGNGKVDPGEQCDWGSAANVHGSGCEPDCTFSCTISPNSCPSPDPCSASPQVCGSVAGPTGNGGQKCNAGPVIAQCGSCGGANICVANVCKADTCGDGCVAGGETCDPPNGTTCDSSCQKILCGDGKLAGSEQCDDGNTINLDGCDSTCRFELDQRATALKILGSVDSFCTKNALGHGALTSTGLSRLQPSIDTDVGNGNINVMFKFMQSGTMPQDLSGTSGPVILGSVGGTPVDADGGVYKGDADLDWWYTVDPTSVDPMRNPLSSLPGSYTMKTLNAGPGRLKLAIVLSGSPATLDMWNVNLTAHIGGTSAPTMSSGKPPGHLASEHLEGGLTTFDNAGQGAQGPAGELCGNITAQSLANVKVPSIIASGGQFACGPFLSYDKATNSLLDVIIGGCTVLVVPAVNATQPDLQDPMATFPAGTTPPYQLSAATSSHVVDTCMDSSSPAKSVPLATCLAGLAYSSAFQFQTDRVIVK